MVDTSNARPVTRDGRARAVALQSLVREGPAAVTSVIDYSSSGRVVIIGNRGPGNQGTVSINPRALMARNADIRGMNLGGASETERVRMHAAIIAGLANGSLSPVIGQEFTLAEAARAHHAVVETRAYGKIVLIP